MGKINRENWWWAGDELWDHWSPIVGFQAIGLLCFYCRVANKDGESWYGNESICKILKCSPNTVRKYNKLLRDQGLIEWQEGGGGAKDTNRVRIKYRVQKMNTKNQQHSNSDRKSSYAEQQAFKDYTRSTTQEGIQNKELVSINESMKGISVNGYFQCSFGEFHAENEECTCFDK